MRQILLISYEFPPVIGGAGSVGYDYAQFLHENDWEVTVLTHFSSNRRPEAFDFRVVQVKSPPKVQPFFFYMKFLQLWKKHSYKRIILNDAGASLMASLFFSKQLMAESLIFLHGSEVEKLYHNRGLMFKILSTQTKYQHLLDNSAHIIAVSHFLKDKFLNRTALQHLTTKIRVIRNAVALPGALSLSPPQEYDPKGRTVLFSACRIVERKGLGKMLHLFRDILHGDDKFVWYIAGEGPYKNELIKLVETLGLKGQVILLGSIPKNRLWSFYAFADCFWLLSDFEEGLGLVFLESALMGCPVVTYRRGGVVEVVNEKTGYLVADDTEAGEIISERRFLRLSRSAIKQEAEIINRDNRSEILPWL